MATIDGVPVEYERDTGEFPVDVEGLAEHAENPQDFTLERYERNGRRGVRISSESEKGNYVSEYPVTEDTEDGVEWLEDARQKVEEMLSDEMSGDADGSRLLYLKGR